MKRQAKYLALMVLEKPEFYSALGEQDRELVRVELKKIITRVVTVVDRPSSDSGGQLIFLNRLMKPE